eukprot:TRINITY_DN4320_c0_g3_i1.p1 TRINITY_DN4320_c0_g3~~TRINITY_DN4320_c0_g3_i1.p1  ORF type:complete len:1843 (-),score=404.46 TRINITY_DN4320_c0_g3_i1:432-5939(-)
MAASVTVVVHSREYGSSTRIVDMTVRCVPSSGSYLGTTVTVIGAQLGNGVDIGLAQIDNVAAGILSQTTTSVVLSLPAHAVGLQSLFVQSTSSGRTYVPFTYFAPVITSVVPSSGPRLSGGYVTVCGTHLGSGSDVVSAAIKGVAATVVSQTASCVTVLTGAYNDVSYAEAVHSAHPLAYWRLGESSGTSATDSASTHHGTYMNSVVLGDAGAIVSDADTAARFVRSSQTYVLVPLSTALASPLFTFEYWAKLGVSAQRPNYFSAIGHRDGSGDLRGIITYWNVGDSYDVSVGCANNAWYGIVMPVPPDPTQWNYIVGTYDGSSLKLYLNGALAASLAVSCYVPNTNFGFQIGSGTNEVTPASRSDYWEGNVDEVALYDRALSASEIANHYRLAQLADVTLQSTSYGASELTGAQYTYNPAPAPISVTPDNGPLAGMTLTISGTALGNGANGDILNVTIGSVDVTVLGHSTVTVTIQGTRAPFALGWNVLVTTSLSHGVATLSNAFFYWEHAQMVVDDDIVIIEGAAVLFRVAIVEANVFQIPTAITVPINVPATTACSSFDFAALSVSFTGATWNVAQTVTVVAVRDYIQLSNNITCTVQLGPTVSDKPQFNGLVKAVTLTMINNDTAGIVSGPHDGLFAFAAGLAIVEATSGWYSVMLHSKPQHDVTLSVTLSSNKLVTNITTLVIQPNQWNAPQQIFLFNPQDNIVDGLQWAHVTSTFQSADVLYNGIASHVQTLLCVDIDGSEAFLSPVVTTYNTTEDAANVPVYIVLTKFVFSNVIITGSASLPQIVITPPTMVVLPSQIFTPLQFGVTSVRNFIAEGTQPFNVSFLATGSGVDQLFMVSMWNNDVDHALLNVSRTSLVVSETGSTDSFTVGVTSRPVLPLVLALECSNTLTCAALSVTRLVISHLNWQLQFAVTVTGLRNPSHNATDQICSITVRYVSGDAAFADAQFVVTVLNRDVHWPRAFRVSPPVVPLVGRNITIQAYDPLPGIAIYVAGSPCINITFAANFTLFCMSSPVNVPPDSYQNISLWNPDGGWQLLIEPVFFTEDCPYEGLYGRGLQCQTCPEGGYCPGGYRMWPLPGFFTFSEFNAHVYPCTPPDACLGGRESTCAEGYANDYCGQCAANYWRADQETCDQCGSQTGVALLLIAQFLFVGLFLVAAMFVNTQTLGNITFVVNSLRALWIVTGDLANLPSTVSSILSVLSLFAADMNFSQPGCSGVSTFLDLWVLNVMVVLGSMGLLCVLLYAQFRFAVRSVYSDEAKRHELVIMQAKFSIHVVRAVFTYVMFVFAVLFTKGFQGVNCVTVDRTIRLNADQSQSCFSSGHAPVFLFSLLLILLTFTVPIVVPILCRKFHRGDAVNAVVRGVVMAAEDEFKDNILLPYMNSVFILGDVSLGLLSEMILDDGWRAVWQIIVILIMALLVAIVRPFNDWWKTCGALIIYVASLLAVVFPVLGDTDVAAGIAWLMVTLMLTFALLALMVCLCSFVRSSHRTAIAKSMLKDGDVVQVPSMNMGSWDDDTIQSVVQDEGRIASVEAVREEIKDTIEYQQAFRDGHAYDKPLLVSRPQEDPDEDDILRLMRRLSVLPTEDLKSLAADRVHDVRTETIVDEWLPSALVQRNETRRASLAPQLLTRRLSVAQPSQPHSDDDDTSTTNSSDAGDTDAEPALLMASLAARRRSSVGLQQSIVSPPGRRPSSTAAAAAQLGTPVQQAPSSPELNVDALVPRGAKRSLSRLTTLRASSALASPADGTAPPRRLSMFVDSSADTFAASALSRRQSLSPLLMTARRDSGVMQLPPLNTRPLPALNEATGMQPLQRQGSTVQIPIRRPSTRAAK